MDNRIELCCHTKMSKLQGINYAKEYIEEAIKRGYKQLAITDKNSIQAFFEANNYVQLYSKNKDFKIIYAIEMDFKENKETEKKYSIYIYVKEQEGLKNLYTLISKSYENLESGQPIIYRKELNEYRKGLLYAAIGENSEIYQNIDATSVLTKFQYYDFIGIEPHKSNKDVNKKIYDICKEYNKTLIGTSECNFINKEDYICNEILNFYKKSNNIEEGNNNYFETTEELLTSFNYIENAEEIVVENPKKIAEQIQNINIVPIKAKCYRKPFAHMIISKKCYDKAHEIYGEILSNEIKERLKLELHSIIYNDYQTIFLIYSELVEYSNKLGYEVGSRGSVGCSLVAYLLGITNIDPIKYNLPFEIFMGKNYDREPDIDLNFSSKIKSKIIAYLQDKFGKNKIIWGGTTGTLADKTVEDCYNEYINTFELEDTLEKEQIIRKITGTKRCTGEHPGGIFIIPEELDILDFTPTEIGENKHLKTHYDYHSLEIFGLYKFDILSHDDFTMLHDLEKETNTKSVDIDLNDVETLKVFLHANDESYEISINGIPEFSAQYTKNIIQSSKPKNFNDLVCISAIAHGTNTWNYNASDLIEREGKKINEVISNREDMYNFFVESGLDSKIAIDIVDFVRRGKAARGRNLWKHLQDRYKENYEKWEEYKEILKEHNIPEWYIHSAEKIEYMFPKAHAISYTIASFKIAWYKVHYPKVFYKVYFKVKSNLNINDYYCKRQIKTELNRLYDEKETNEINKEYEKDWYIDDKIKDLELLLEMYDRGIIKEKAEIKDDYNLINSRAIADYCRMRKHKFNTEELAVLVHRNNRMNIYEKIEKYNDLIKNYPDMEVIERINCKHYDSVKDMIKKEIKRINVLSKKFIQEEDNCIYVWTEYNKTTLKYECSNDIEHTFKTYKEAFNDIQRYIKEYDDTISFRITKKYFEKKKGKIYADYAVKNKKTQLIDITESTNSFLDIDQIFLNIPTPFKKGDILISKNQSIYSYGDYSEMFVLDYLCTWREDLNKFLAKGNYDSSDMVGYGYYLYREDSTEFVRDHKWNYDSFEYYDGEFTGNNRILKDISSFLKGKIELELFVHAYDFYKTEFKNRMPNFYTDEGLKLAGMNKQDIVQVNYHENEKIYNLNETEQDNIFKLHTCIYKKLKRNEIKQIVTDYDNTIYVLTIDGNLYKTEEYEDELELLSKQITKVYCLDGKHLYKITDDNIIQPIEDIINWCSTDKYLNNNNCKYKKIETSLMHIVALTNDGKVRAVCGGYPNLGILPENFIDVDDITIVEDEDGIDTPFIYKNNIFLELYM